MTKTKQKTPRCSPFKIHFPACLIYFAKLQVHFALQFIESKLNTVNSRNLV